MTVRVLIVDDHSIVREGLHMFLVRDSELEVVGEASDGAEALQQARLLHPDVVIMDLLMPTLDGVTATRAIRSELPETRVLVLTSVTENTLVIEAMQAGATGYLLKNTQAAELRNAIKATASGQVYLSPHATAHLLNTVCAPTHSDPLTPREMDVLRLLVQGHSNKEIARKLHLVEETVKFHVRHILDKLGVQSRTQAVLAAIRLRIVLPQP